MSQENVAPLDVDARSLPPLDQERIRFQAVAAVLDGLSVSSAARTFGVTRQAVYNWLKAHRLSGIEALLAKPKGRPPAEALFAESGR